MEMDKSIALQKTVRDNAQSLQDEFFDMKYWEEQMKKADSELSANSNQDQKLPPIRKKKITSKTKPKTKDNGSKTKRIKSHDYSAWESFDADRACEEIEKENESDESVEELISQEELEKAHDEATKHKVMGNKYVSEQKWDKAIACYNEAIKFFPYDAVFYANRALCHLKMNNLYSVEADCTLALQQDEHYVKAYHRRATARIALKQYAEAVEDLKRLLNFEPNNKEAQKMLQTAQEILEKSKPSVKSKPKDDDGKKKVEISKCQVSNEEKSSDVITEVKSTRKKIEKVEEVIINRAEKKYRVWLPDVEDDVDIVETIEKSPHQRMKKPLRSVPIVVKNFSESSSIISNGDENKTAEKISKVRESHSSEKKKCTKNDANSDTSETTVDPIVPPVPKTSVQFLSVWKKYKSPDFRYKYLKQLSPEFIPKIFQDSMESDIFSEIINILKSQFLDHKDPVFQYITCMSEIKRFRTLTMFMGKQEKQDLITIFEYCKTAENQSDDIIQQMRDKYEV